ncbi:nucleotidyltransferase family protein, partial [Oleiphilus sp. HI0123]
IHHAVVNTHYLSELVSKFLKRPQYASWIKEVFEPELLGTASSLRQNQAFFKNATTLLIHADNWCHCNFSAFIEYHCKYRPDNCPITMMTFDTELPQSCGIVELDSQNRVIGFHEKVSNPPGNRANAAVYLLEPEILDWLELHPEISDFSTQVLPQFVGRIATWHNDVIHRDIGTYSALRKAQLDPLPLLNWPAADSWQKEFDDNPIHSLVNKDK